MNIHEPSQATGKSVSTIRRHKAELLKYGAFCGRPAWKVTREQAEKAGLFTERSLNTHEHSGEHSASPVEVELRAHIQLLKDSLEREKTRADLLERTLEQEKQEKLLWLQGYLSETRQISPPQPHSTETTSTPENTGGFFARWRRRT